MRHVLSAVAVLSLWAAPAAAQVGRDIRFVTAETAEVRSGQSDSPEFYVTNRLRRGQPVEVVRELPGGWLAIVPPEGSFSYINARFLRHLGSDQPNYVVTLDNHKVQVFIGSEVVNKRPTVVGSMLVPGTQVANRGKPVSDEEGSWMPITPPAQEQRYIKAAAVAKNAPTVAAAAPVAAKPNDGGPAPSANAPLTLGQMWLKAQQAERNGQVTEAVRLYALVGAEAAQVNPQLSAQALERAQYLQVGHQRYGAMAGVSPVQGTPVSMRAQAVQVGAPARPGTGTPPATSSFTPAAQPAAANAQGMATYRGMLRRAGRAVEGRTMYALDGGTTVRPLLYATPGSGVNLEAYLDKEVDLTGYARYDGGLRNTYMIVTRVDRR